MAGAWTTAVGGGPAQALVQDAIGRRELPLESTALSVPATLPGLCGLQTARRAVSREALNARSVAPAATTSPQHSPTG